MYRKLIWLFSFVLILSMASNISAELVGYWPLNGDALDMVGNHHGTLVGGASFVVDTTRGMVLSVDGVDGHIEVPNSPDMVFNASASYTIMAWASVPQVPAGWHAVMAKSRDQGTHYGIWICDTAQWMGGGWDNRGSAVVPQVWVHIAYVQDGAAGTGTTYINGAVDWSGGPRDGSGAGDFWIGGAASVTEFFGGMIDEVRVYNHALTEEEIQVVMLSGGKGYPYSSGPVPKDGAVHADTWASMSWRAGDFAVSHDIYFGENFDDVNDGTGDTFRGNQTDTFYIAGFPGFAYPDGLVNGSTYYWRIDEVNDADPNSPWKGDVWSFSIPPKTAYSPNPTDGAEFVDLNAQLKWTAGFGTKLHYIVFGEDFAQVSSAVAGIPSGTANYNPGQLNLAKTYYWRVDEFDGAEKHKGQVWSFTTEGAVSGPNPADGAADVKPSVVLGWVAGAVAASHEVYFGTDADAVAVATKTSPEYKGPKSLGEESYDPGKLSLNTTYYWRIDEVNDSPDSPWAGNVWSFTTGDFFVIDDFEDYNAGENQIWYAWHDGLGYGTPGTADYFAGNETGAAVGDETTASYTEETIVHGGGQSMPVIYDNNKQNYSKYSEVELKLTDPRDWTEQGVSELSLWFRGYPASTGSFVEGPVGTYTMTASGADIWAVNGVEADEFHFAYKMLTGAGSIVVKVVSVENTNVWAKAGVMIRETLDPDSAHAMMVVTPGSGVSFQRRPGTAQTSLDTTTTAITAPYWVKLERSISGGFTASHSANGTTWTTQGTENVPMGSNVYIGLAVTAHNAAATCEAVFSNVTTTGNVSGQWTHQDIGIASNDAEPLYVAVSNSTGTPALVVNDDPAAAQADTWTEWIIPLQAFADQGINLTNVDRIAIGMGTRGNMTAPGGSGKMFFDDIRLYAPPASDTIVEPDIIELSDANFDEIVLGSELPVLVDFWAPWCGPCLLMTPVIEEIASEYAGKAVICKLNTDDARDTALRLDITAIPTLMLYKNGQQQKKWIGVTDKQELTLAIDELL